MAVESHIHSLKARHSELEAKIKELMSNTIVDDTKLSDLKRRKLQLKDKITELSKSAMH